MLGNGLRFYACVGGEAPGRAGVRLIPSNLRQSSRPLAIHAAAEGRTKMLDTPV